MNAAVHYITGPALPFVALVTIGAIIIAWAEHVAHLRRRMARLADDLAVERCVGDSLGGYLREDAATIAGLRKESAEARTELAEFRGRFDRPRGDGGRYLPQSK